MAEGDQLLRVTTPEAEGLSPKTGAEIAHIFFSAASSDSVQGNNLVAENTVHRALVHNMYLFLDDNGNQIAEQGERKIYEFNTYVFVSRDYSYLEAAFKLNAPGDDEICVFLEDNDGDLFTKAGLWIRVGKHFRQSKDLLHKVAASDYAAQHLAPQGLGLSEQNIDVLVRKGFLLSSDSHVALSLLAFVQLLNYPLAWLVGKLGNAALTVTAGLRPYLTFSAESWDPANAPEGEQSFSPLLFPAHAALLEAIFSADGTVQLAKPGTALDNALDQELENRLTHLVAHGQMPASTLPTDLGKMDLALNNNFMQAAMDACFELFDKARAVFQAGAKQCLQAMAYLSQRILNAVNAFLCGLWNALVETVLGTIDMVAYALVFLSKGNEFLSNATENIPRLNEVIEEIVQGLRALDFSLIMNELVRAVSRINIQALFGTVSIERTAYFCGNILGSLVELGLGFFTGGASSARAIVGKLGAAGAKVERLFMQTITKLGSRNLKGTSARKITPAVFELFDQLRLFLTQGTKVIVRFIRTLFDELVGMAKVSREALARIMKQLRLSTADIQAIERMGMAIVDDTADGAGAVCKMCRVVRQVT